MIMTQQMVWQDIWGGHGHYWGGALMFGALHCNPSGYHTVWSCPSIQSNSLLTGQEMIPTA